MSQAEKAVKAGKEINDLIRRLTDETDNKSEVIGLLNDVVEAGGAAYQLQSGLTKAEYDDALAVIGATIAGDIATRRVVFADGSKVEITVSAIEP